MSGISEADIETCARVLTGQGPHPKDIPGLLTWAPVALARMLRRDTTLEEWHSAGRIHEAEMMAANVATTRIIRDTMWTQSADGLLEGADSSHDLTLECIEVLEGRDAFAPDRGLPDGIALAGLAGDELEEFSNRAGHTLNNLLDLFDNHSPHTTLMLLATWGKQARWWWITPAWPYQVDEFLQRAEPPTT